ncbi:MAG: glycosyltransferase family 2 protein [Bacteroidia bacterium]|nr:glycosyltransferase family 2 protein [Bacteroidia bacterium]
MRHLVSIITPSFNCGKYIGTTIESVRNQTFTDWELIIVDDGSTDNSAEIIRHYTKSDDRIKALFFPSNQGAAAARNAGLLISKGRYIAFLDSDDVWLPNKLGVQLEFMKTSGAPISFTEYEVYDEDMLNCQHHIKVPIQIDYPGYLKTTIIGMSTAIIDTDKTGTISFYDIRTRQDTYLWITLLKKGFIAYGIHEPFTKYRNRKDSISANKLKAAQQVWHLYYDLEMMSFFKAVYFFLNYGMNSVKKRFA